MQLQLVQATSETREFDEIVRAFTPPMRRVCPHLAESALREMIERMAMHRLAEAQQQSAAPRRRRTLDRQPIGGRPHANRPPLPRSSDGRSHAAPAMDA
jgi:hypothetical protein